MGNLPRGKGGQTDVKGMISQGSPWTQRSSQSPTQTSMSKGSRFSLSLPCSRSRIVTDIQEEKGGSMVQSEGCRMQRWRKRLPSPEEEDWGSREACLLSSWEIKPLFLVERACFLRSTTTGCWGFKTRALQTLRRSELSPKSSHSKPLNCSLLYQ